MDLSATSADFNKLDVKGQRIECLRKLKESESRGLSFS